MLRVRIEEIPVCNNKYFVFCDKLDLISAGLCFNFWKPGIFLRRNSDEDASLLRGELPEITRLT